MHGNLCKVWLCLGRKAKITMADAANDCCNRFLHAGRPRFSTNRCVVLFRKQQLLLVLLLVLETAATRMSVSSFAWPSITSVPHEREPPHADGKNTGDWRAKYANYFQSSRKQDDVNGVSWGIWNRGGDSGDMCVYIYRELGGKMCCCRAGHEWMKSA